MPSLSPFSSSRVKLPRRRGLKVRSCLSGCAVPSLRLRGLLLPPAAEVQDEIDHAFRDLQQRAEARERTGGYASGFRCWGCRRFVASRTATCPHCGQLHGGVYHDAYPTR